MQLPGLECSAPRGVCGLINASVTVCEDVGGMPIKVVGDMKLR